MPRAESATPYVGIDVSKDTLPKFVDSGQLALDINTVALRRRRAVLVASGGAPSAAAGAADGRSCPAGRRRAVLVASGGGRGPAGREGVRWWGG